MQQITVTTCCRICLEVIDDVGADPRVCPCFQKKTNGKEQIHRSAPTVGIS